MKFKVVGERILIKEIDQDVSQTEGGLFIPDSASTAKAKPIKGTVVLTGYTRDDSGNRQDLDISVGDEVVVELKHYTKLELEGEELLLVPVEFVIGYFSSKPELLKKENLNG